MTVRNDTINMMTYDGSSSSSVIEWAIERRIQEQKRETI